MLMNANESQPTADATRDTSAPELPTYAPEQLAPLAADALMELLVRDEDRVPRVLIDECVRRGDAMVSTLGAIATDDCYWRDDLSAGEAWLPLHAVMILGLIPTRVAGLLILDIMRRTEREEDEDLQDWFSGYWPALFRDKPEDMPPALRKLSQNRDLDWYTRIQAIEAVVAAAESEAA
jgi:hypothetical protein